jgi:hypothetical protein
MRAELTIIFYVTTEGFNGAAGCSVQFNAPTYRRYRRPSQRKDVIENYIELSLSGSVSVSAAGSLDKIYT